VPGVDDLYQQLILDHYRNPRGGGRLAAATATAEEHNPMCGDEVTLDVLLEDGRLTAIAHVGEGCSISRASASMLADTLPGRDADEALALIERFRLVMHGDADVPDELGDAVALEGVARFPARVKCALMSWLAARSAIEAALLDNPTGSEVADGQRG
jgi:nitrogen fixation NifU-like protein